MTSEDEREVCVWFGGMVVGIVLAILVFIGVVAIANAGERVVHNVGIKAVLVAPIWPPPRAPGFWAANKTDFVAYKRVEAIQTATGVCNTPPERWHGLARSKCDKLKDGSVACMYRISTEFTGTDGFKMGGFHGYMGLRRKTCKAPWVPEVVELIPDVDNKGLTYGGGDPA